MTKRILLHISLLLLFTLPAKLSAQVSENAYDSIMSIMHDKSIPLLERYYMTGEISYFPREQQINILKSLVPEAKEFDDKAVITRLYSLIAQFKVDLNQFNEAKLYLDSAFAYKDKFDNIVISGVLYLTNGSYHANQNNMTQAQESYYKAAQYFEKRDKNLNVLIDLYYNLSSIHSMWNDVEALYEIRQKMKDIPVFFSYQNILKYSVDARYFHALYIKDNKPELLDSITKYNILSINVYDESKDPYEVGLQVSTNYLDQSLIYAKTGKINEAEKFYAEGVKLSNHKSDYYNIRLLLISGILNYHKKDYTLAEKDLLEGIKRIEELTETQKIDYYNISIEFYDELSKVYEQQGLYDKSLEMAKKSLAEEKRLFDRDNINIVQDLRAKYNLDQKEKAVHNLTVLNEKSKRINMLTILIILLCLLVIVLLYIRFRQNKRMSKNKLQIVELGQKKMELQVRLQEAKLEEKEKLFQSLVSETEQRRIKSYLEGLEGERKRLAKNLHDNVSNEVVAIQMQIENGTVSTDKILERLQDLHGEIRGISHELIPPVFQYATLKEILEYYVEQRNQLNKTEIELNFVPEYGWDNLSNEICLEVYRSIQEITGNAIKYANATRITINLSMEQDRIIILIVDNGIGFDVQKNYKGIGLHIINERIEVLKGELNLESEIGKGTRFEVVIPL